MWTESWFSSWYDKVKLLQVDSRYYVIKEYFTHLLQSLVKLIFFNTPKEILDLHTAM